MEQPSSTTSGSTGTQVRQPRLPPAPPPNPAGSTNRMWTFSRCEGACNRADHPICRATQGRPYYPLPEDSEQHHEQDPEQHHEQNRMNASHQGNHDPGAGFLDRARARRILTSLVPRLWNRRQIDDEDLRQLQQVEQALDASGQGTDPDAGVNDRMRAAIFLAGLIPRLRYYGRVAEDNLRLLESVALVLDAELGWI